MKSVTLRLPDALIHEIEAEARQRKMSKTDIMRERLIRKMPGTKLPPALEAIADLLGSIDHLPADLSSHANDYLGAGHGRKRHR